MSETATPPDQQTAAAGRTHGFCKGCEWFATPGEHSFANVPTAAERHSFESGHTVSVGCAEEIVTEARRRASAVTDAGGGDADE